MRWTWLVVVVLACRKETPPPPPTPPPPAVPQGPSDAAASDAATSGPIDLLRAVPATVRVSSRVNNGAILPRHLVDRDLNTAWNSATGELVGAWIDVTLEQGGTIDELRITAGFTGHGPKGEDYFTMNPRIRQVALTADGKPAGTFRLDIARRDLQAIPVHAMHVLRIEVAAIEPGTKASWRETSVSELEVWGSPPPGWKPPPRPRVPAVVVYQPPSEATGPCASIDADRAAFIKEHEHDHYEGPGGEDHAYPPSCELLELQAVNDLDPMWASNVGICEIHDEIYGPKTCSLTFEHAGETASITVESPAASAEIKVADMSPHDVIPGDPPELVVHWTNREVKSVAICRAHPFACTVPIETAGDGWATRERFDKGELVLELVSGTPPSGAVGRHTLTFGK